MVKRGALLWEAPKCFQVHLKKRFYFIFLTKTCMILTKVLIRKHFPKALSNGPFNFCCISLAKDLISVFIQCLAKKDKEDQSDPSMDAFYDKLSTAYEDPVLMPIRRRRSTDGHNSPLLPADVWSKQSVYFCHTDNQKSINNCVYLCYCKL